MQTAHVNVWLLLILNILPVEQAFAVNKGFPYLKDGERYDFEFVYNFTQYLQGINRFNSFVIFSHDKARQRPNFLVVRTFEQALCVDFNMPIITWGKEKSAKLRNVIGLNNMVFVQMISMRDDILDAVDYTLEGLHFITILFFYKAEDNTPPTALEIRKFFVWCWKRNMLNVALTFQIIERIRPGLNTTYVQNQVYVYRPFPTLQIYNLTDEVAKGRGEFRTNSIQDVKGYKFETPTYQQIPYAFVEAHDKHCKGLKYCSNSLTGTSGRIFTEYIKSIKGTIELVEKTGDVKHEVLLAPAMRKAHIVPHPFSELILSTDSSAGSYPIAQTNLCIILPVEREMAYELYLPLTFQTEIWFWILATFLLLLTLEIIFNFKAANFGIQALSYVLILTVNLILDQPRIMRLERAGGTVYKCYHNIMPFFTFVLISLFVTSLTSLLSTTPYGVQIDTVAQFLASNLEIMTTARERTFFFETNRLPAELIPKLHIVDQETFEKHRKALNDSYAYTATAELWTLLDHQQRHLRKPLFRVGGWELCTSNFFLRLPVQWDSPFTLSLDLFFMLMQETGHAFKWEELSKQQAKKLNFVKSIQKDVERWKPLGLQHFKFVFYFMYLMWLLELVCFMIELLWFCALGDMVKEFKEEYIIRYRRLKQTMSNL